MNSPFDTLIAKASVSTLARRDRGSRTDAIAACETAWIPYLFVLPQQIFFLPGRPSRRNEYVWNLWAVAQPWPESLAYKRLAYRNGWANLRPIWSACIDETPRHWRMTVRSWRTATTHEGRLDLALIWAAWGNMHRVYAAYPPPLRAHTWAWDPKQECWSAEFPSPSWPDLDLLAGFAAWVDDPHDPSHDTMLSEVWADITVPPRSPWDTLVRWWRRS